MTEAQKTLYYIAENMRMDKSISKEGYEHFQQAIKALEQEPIKSALEDIKAKIPNMTHWQSPDGQDLVMVADMVELIDKHMESEDKE